jgi:hypothetical protein
LRVQVDTTAILSRFPGPIVLRTARLKALFVLATGVVLSFGGLIMIREGEAWGWLVFVFFLLMAAVGFVMLLPGAGRLLLDAEGFEVTSLFRRGRSRWADVSGFEVTRIPPAGQKMVVFDDVRTKDSALAKVTRSLAGRSGGLPDNYGLSYEELAAIMNEWRRRATSRT